MDKRGKRCKADFSLIQARAVSRWLEERSWMDL